MRFFSFFRGLIQYNLIHTLLLEYLTHCSENSRKDMIENVKEKLIHMIHTREGSRLAMHCIWNTSAKVSLHLKRSAVRCII